MQVCSASADQCDQFDFFGKIRHAAVAAAVLGLERPPCDCILYCPLTCNWLCDDSARQRRWGIHLDCSSADAGLNGIASDTTVDASAQLRKAFNHAAHLTPCT